MNITNFFTTFITDITNSFSNLSIDKIYLLIVFSILIIFNNLKVIASFMKLGASSGNPIARTMTLFELKHYTIHQILITTLFLIIFIDTNALNYLILIILPFVLTILIFTIIAKIEQYILWRY